VGDGSDVPRHVASYRDNTKSRIPLAPILITLGTVALAALLAWAMWQAYMAAPWTRDGTVRVYVVTMAPEVAGRIIKQPVADNQFVHKGDVLFEIDPADYRIALERATPPRSTMPARTRAEKPISQQKGGPRKTSTSRQRARCISPRRSSPWTRPLLPRRSSISAGP
jgi:multidrug resistance efflux pump